MKSYVGKSNKDVIPDIIALYTTWDNYSLSVLYLRALSRMFPQGVKRNKVIVRFTQLLLLNISPDPSSRVSLEETRKQFQEIFFEGGDVEDYKNIVDSFSYGTDLATHAISEDIVKPQVKS